MISKTSIPQKLIFAIAATALFASCGNSTNKEDMKTSIENKKEILVLFGAPGSGKGTLAQRAAKELGYTTLSTGDLCRQNIEKGTDLGKTLKGYIDKGELVPDSLISDMVKVWLTEQQSSKNPIILDGYPRTKSQAETLVTLLADPNFSNLSLKVVKFAIREEEVVDRIANRLVCENKKCQAVYSLKSKKPAKEGICDLCGSKLIKRTDDNEEVVKNRFKIYSATENEILNFFSEKGISIKEISATQPVDEVYESFKKIVK
ncbi:TPA: adenylate kinase [Candidatus Dependentiae bacterium]|nr:MAG: Adenylate kinase [candidate division TM6 bacterium GW2011_GWE2_31_21]KKP53761.1 MAG: Adenylate kinase [candidate division TM6 bacterium GW2011_GWF2_33_332]HBS48485.1 adenylate kinase [Candidatus Dependentiae bacterium]HBZ73100.1 adenylate kinase [Candidatus Dependentiae bacterium]